MTSAKKEMPAATATVPVAAKQKDYGVRLITVEHDPTLGFFGNFAKGASYLKWMIMHPHLAFAQSAGLFGLAVVGFLAGVWLLNFIVGGSQSDTGNPAVDLPANSGQSLRKPFRDTVNGIRGGQTSPESSNFQDGIKPDQ